MSVPTNKKSSFIGFSSALILLLLQTNAVEAAKFAVNGPILTVTLKDTGINLNDQLQGGEPSPRGQPSSNHNDMGERWSAVDLTALRPNLFWSIESESPPLPKWLPSWTSMRANIGYRYDELKHLPSFVEADLKFRSERWNAELQVQPSYELRARRANILMQISQGASYVLARLSTGSKDSSSNSKYHQTSSFSSPAFSNNNVLEFLRASYNIQFPAKSSVSSMRITPSIDISKGEPSCVIEGVTGGSGRTKAVLKLNFENPTLAMVHALDDRNTIAPEISLYNAKVIYQWNVSLNNIGSSLRTRVDPTSAIDVTWTDTSAADGGRWVTDFRLPLEGTSIRALASDVRVRRQFNF